MVQELSISERRACRYAGLSRTSYREPPSLNESTASLSTRIVELAHGISQFAGAHAGEQQQPNAQLRSEATLIFAQRLQHRGQLVHAQEGIVFDRRQRHRHHIQVLGRVLAQVGHHH